MVRKNYLQIFLINIKLHHIHLPFLSLARIMAPTLSLKTGFLLLLLHFCMCMSVCTNI